MSEMISVQQLNEWIDRIYQLCGFLSGNGDVCEIAAKRLRMLASDMESALPETKEEHE